MSNERMRIGADMSLGIGTDAPTLGAAIGTGVLAGTTTDTFTYNGASVTDTSALVYNTANRYQIANTTAQHNIVFHGPGGKEVGRFDFNEGTVKFEGDANEAAKVFTEWARKNWDDLRRKDKTEALDEVIHDIIAESSGELYSEEEKVAMLTCLQLAQRRKDELGQGIGLTVGSNDVNPLYAQNIAKQAPLTPVGVQARAMAALAPEGKSNA